MVFIFQEAPRLIADLAGAHRRSSVRQADTGREKLRNGVIGNAEYAFSER